VERIAEKFKQQIVNSHSLY